MKKHIAEELPARKFAPAAASAGKGDDDKKEKGAAPEKRVKQAIYDIRYRARREELPLRQAYSQYMQNSSMSAQEKTMVKQKLFSKSGGMQAEEFNIEDFASTSVANALYKIFVEGVEKEQEPIRLTYMEKLETSEHKKYKVRVTGKDGRSYVRYADRQKISELRLNPNIESVEMTGYGEPYEGEKNKGEQTAKVKAGKDYDGDGKVESGPKEYRGVVHNAIQRKKGGKPDGQDTSSVKEEFIGEVKSENDDSDKKIDVLPKGRRNKVTPYPEAPGTKNGRSNYSLQMNHYDMGGNLVSEAHSKFLRMLQEKAESEQQQKLFGLALSVKRGETPRSEASAEVLKIVDTMSEKKIRDFAKTKHEGIPKKVKEEKECSCEDEDKDKKKEMDPREIPTKKNLVKNNLRAMGLEMSYEPEGEVLGEEEYDTTKDQRLTGRPGGRYQGDDVKELQRRIDRGDLFKNLQGGPPIRGAKNQSKTSSKTA